MARTRRILGSFSLGLLASAAVALQGLPACVSSSGSSVGGGSSSSGGGSGSSSSGSGSGSGSSSGSGSGSGGTGSSSGNIDAGSLCVIETPAGSSIVDFTPLDGSAPDKYSWGYSTPNAFSGYSYSYPTGAITSDVTSGAWRLSGQVGDYSGFGLGFACSVDASAFAGVTFTVKGTAGTPSVLTFTVSTAADDVIDLVNSPTARAGCTPVKSQYDGTCAQPYTTINVPANGATINVNWGDLKGGAPSPFKPSELTRLAWSFAWPVNGADGAPMAYPVDVTIDNVAFLTSPATDASVPLAPGGGSSSGGSSSGGSSSDAGRPSDAATGGQ